MQQRERHGALLIKPAADGVFGKGGSRTPGRLYRHADQLRQKGIVFYLKDREGIKRIHIDQIRIQKILAAGAGAYPSVQRNAYISGRIEEGLSIITDDRAGTQACSLQLAVEFQQKGIF